MPAMTYQEPGYQTEVGGGFPPDYVLSLNAPTEGFLVGANANEYAIDFIGFKIRDYNSGTTLFEISKEPQDPSEVDTNQPVDDSARTIRYDFGADFLELNTIGTTLTFNVGPKDVRNFRMIESHYFQWPDGQWERIKAYDFAFPFCPHNTHNTWEVVYDMPDFRPDLKQAIIDNPWRTQSDSFYFVEDQLIMQNKAMYSYQQHNYDDPNAQAQQQTNYNASDFDQYGNYIGNGGEQANYQGNGNYDDHPYHNQDGNQYQ